VQLQTRELAKQGATMYRLRNHKSELPCRLSRDGALSVGVEATDVDAQYAAATAAVMTNQVLQKLKNHVPSVQAHDPFALDLKCTMLSALQSWPEDGFKVRITSWPHQVCTHGFPAIPSDPALHV
jgi:hypothetical protein